MLDSLLLELRRGLAVNSEGSFPVDKDAFSLHAGTEIERPSESL